MLFFYIYLLLKSNFDYSDIGKLQSGLSKLNIPKDELDSSGILDLPTTLEKPEDAQVRT